MKQSNPKEIVNEFLDFLDNFSPSLLPAYTLNLMGTGVTSILELDSSESNKDVCKLVLLSSNWYTKMPQLILNRSFNWEYTEEGKDFWLAINNKWRELLKAKETGAYKDIEEVL